MEQSVHNVYFSRCSTFSRFIQQALTHQMTLLTDLSMQMFPRKRKKQSHTDSINIKLYCKMQCQRLIPFVYMHIYPV